MSISAATSAPPGETPPDPFEGLLEVLREILEVLQSIAD